MSKAAAASMLLVEAAKRSCSSPNVRAITQLAWSETCRDPQTQKFVVTNTNPSRGLFKKLVTASPPPSDFEALHDEILPRISHLSRLDEVQAVFHGYAAELLLYGEICGAVSEGIAEIAAEKLEEELAHIL